MSSVLPRPSILVGTETMVDSDVVRGRMVL